MLGDGISSQSRNDSRFAHIGRSRLRPESTREVNHTSQQSMKSVACFAYLRRLVLFLFLSLLYMQFVPDAQAFDWTWTSGRESGKDPLAVASATCATEPGVGGAAHETFGIHGEYNQFYGFGCDNGGWIDTLIKYWTCDGKYWRPYTVDGRPEFATCRLEKNAGPTCGVGNPVNPSYGNKYQEETDYASSGLSPLRFSRTYNSKGDVQPTALGLRWRSSYDRSLSEIVGTTAPGIWLSRPDGRGLYFTLKKNGVPVPLVPYDSAAEWTSDADISDRLTRLVDGSGNTLGWSYHIAASEEVETYDSTGRLTNIVSRSGVALSLAYNPQGKLSVVTDTFGRQLTLAYDGSGYLQSMVDPSGATYLYAHDAAGNTTAVTFPGGATRGYVYNEPAFTQSTNQPYALTGITDELGQRFATFGYNNQGDAISTEHAGGVNRYALTYSFAGSTSTIIDPLGVSRTSAFTSLLGVNRCSGISQPCPTCGTNSSAITFDTNGNVASRADFNGKKVCYSYDLTRNLETSRVEGILSGEACTAVLASPPSRPDVRKTTTTWNANYRLPATVTEPAPGGSKTTTLTYDALGNLTQKTIVAPKNDGTGNTITRTWSWTYATLGRVLTATDPNNNVTTYTYYAGNDANLGGRGNVQTITNALGHVTQITAYDANARPLTVVDPNGLATTLTYDARGRLTNRNVGGEQTSYVYDGVGQLTGVVLPDNSTLTYTYDAAHRLTQIQDGLGNKIVYTLDAAGNRTQERVYDTGNVLARTRSRVYDALNRLAQDLGAPRSGIRLWL